MAPCGQHLYASDPFASKAQSRPNTLSPTPKIRPTPLGLKRNRAQTPKMRQTMRHITASSKCTIILYHSYHLPLQIQSIQLSVKLFIPNRRHLKKCQPPPKCTRAPNSNRPRSQQQQQQPNSNKSQRQQQQFQDPNTRTT